MGRGAAAVEKPNGNPVAPLRGRLPAGDIGETWQVIDRETDEVLAECPTPDAAQEFIDEQADAEQLEMTGPDPA